MRCDRLIWACARRWCSFNGTRLCAADAASASRRSRRSRSFSPRQIVRIRFFRDWCVPMIHGLVTCRCQRRPAFTVLSFCLNVLLPSLLRITADRFPFLLFHAFHSVVLPWHREYISIAEAFLVGNVRCATSKRQ